MADATPNTEQENVSVPPVIDGVTVSSADLASKVQEQQEVKFAEQEEQIPTGDPEDVPRTEFMNLKEALMMGQAQLKRIPHLNPESLRRFLLADLYPILIEIADFSNWYVGDLHNRVMGLELGENEGFGGEALSPELANQLIQFIGMSVQIFGVILQSPKADPRLVETAQFLVTKASGLISKVQDITMAEEPDDEEEYDEDEEEEDEDVGDDDNGQSVQPTEVLEPRKREPIQIVIPAQEHVAVSAAVPAAESLKEAVAEPSVVTPAAASPDVKAEEGQSDG